MSKKTVKISAVKGRPMLTWVGKRPLRQVTAYPAQKIETYNPADAGEDSGLLLHGDNKECLAWLLSNGYRGKVKLVYIDPPFDSGADYVRQVKLRDMNGHSKVEATQYTVGEQIQYSDIWENDNYLQFMYERLTLLKELMADGGSFFLHCDPKRVHQLRCLIDEVFGSENFVNEIIWSYKRWPSNSPKFQSMHDNLLFYGVEIADKRTFNKQYEEASESYLQRFGGKTQVLDEAGTRKITLDEETKGLALRDVWEISVIAAAKSERTSYPTQKPEELLARIIEVCSNEGDLILDCFSGSGTSAAVAQKLGRRWIACDINKGAIQITTKRLQTIIDTQIQQQSLDMSGDDLPIQPATTSFDVYRVNDYDLQIQHNEAMQLAMEHIGATTTNNDPFFDGVRGGSLVKLIPFERPLTPLDLQAIQQELDNRPEETRNITLICLGKELASDEWLNNWNQLRKGSVPNKIDVIELRTDTRFGGFLVHQPAQARVSISYKDDKLTITINEFVSPTIISRLKQQSGLLTPEITDWRSMVDTVMIDTNYDGKLFNITLSDVPHKKNDLVRGHYTFDMPTQEVVIAVKITDMLGEELLTTINVTPL